MPADASFGCEPRRGTGPGGGCLGAAWAEGAGNRRRGEREEEENFCFPCAAVEGGGKGVRPPLALPTSPSGVPTGKNNPAGRAALVPPPRGFPRRQPGRKRRHRGRETGQEASGGIRAAAAASPPSVAGGAAAAGRAGPGSPAERAALPRVPTPGVQGRVTLQGAGTEQGEHHCVRPCPPPRSKFEAPNLSHVFVFPSLL